MDETYAEGKAVAVHSKDQEPDFKLIDSLHRAAIQGTINEELEEHGKHLDQILTPSGNTILHIYIISRSRQPGNKKTDEFVSKVLGMCPNLLLKANKKVETPLHFAARYGHDDIVKELLEECQKLYNDDQENGVEPKKQMLQKTNEAEDTALHEAIRYNHTDVVNKLIEADTEVPYDANGSGETPLYLAAERGYEKVVEKILAECKSPADHGPMGRTALHAAVIRRDEDMANRLLEKIKDLSRKKDELGRFALHYGALLGYDKIVDTLLREYPSAAYQADNDGNTALHLAAGNGKAKAVNKLIEICPNCCELVDNRGRNALHLALTSANYSTIKIFLEEPALGNLINQKDNEGDTPLLQLANSGSYIRTFISDHKVDKLVFNKNNKNAADIISDKGSIMDDRDMFLCILQMTKEKRCRRIIDPGQIIKGAEGTHHDGSDEIEEIIKSAQDKHLVAATLIATVTFAAGFTLPGGYIGEDRPNAGTALLTRSAAFQAFVVFNTTAFFLSCASVFVHFTMALQTDRAQLFKQFKHEIRLTSYAMFAMLFAFVTALYAVLYPVKSLAITSCVIGCLLGAHFSAQHIKEIRWFINNQEYKIYWKNMKEAAKKGFYSD